MTEVSAKPQRSYTAIPADMVEAGRADNKMAHLHGIVLAGVHSWGDCLLDQVICRPAIPIAAQPLICHTLQWLRDQGIRTASLCANSDSGYLRQHLSDGSHLGLALDYYEDIMPRGPAGSLRDAAAFSPARLYLVVHGTIVTRFDLHDLLRVHEASGAWVTVLASPTGSHRQDNGDLEPAGVYIVSREALDYIPTNGYQDIKESLLPTLYALGKGAIMQVAKAGAVRRVMDTSSYVSVCRWVVKGITSKPHLKNGYTCIGDACVHKTAHVSPTARLIGPVVIEEGCTVEQEAMIIGPSIIGAGCLVGPRAVISRSILWSGCRIGANVILDDTVLTDNAVIKHGLVIRNTVCTNSHPQRPAPETDQESLVPQVDATPEAWGSLSAVRPAGKAVKARAFSASEARLIASRRPAPATRSSR